MNTSKLLDGTLAELYDIETAEVSFVPAGANGLPLLAIKGLEGEFKAPPAGAPDTTKADQTDASQQEPSTIIEQVVDPLTQLARKILEGGQPELVEVAKLMDAATVKIHEQAGQIRSLKRQLEKAQQRVAIPAHIPDSHDTRTAKTQSPWPLDWRGGQAHGLVGRDQD